MDGSTEVRSAFATDVRDRVVIVTGGGQGIGRVYVREFANSGARVIVADIDAANAEAAASEIVSDGGQAHAVRVDVGDAGSVEAMAAAARKAFGRIDVLINNAAIFSQLDRRGFEDIPLEEWNQVLHVNITGSMMCARAVLPTLRAAGWGRIINISSSTVPLGLPGFMHYVTSKAAVIGMTRAMARELGADGITVNAIMPGLIETEVENRGRTDAVRERVLGMQCVDFLGRPNDLVGMLLFLASPASGYMTGQSVAVDGGCVHL